MEIPKKYFHDRTVLVLLGLNGFVVALTTVLILLRLDISGGDSYIVQYRSNLGLEAFQAGGASTFFAFILFSFFVLIFNTVLSMRVYKTQKRYATTILALTLVLLVFSTVVSNALLVLR